MTCLIARDNPPAAPTCFVEVDTALFWNWVHHLDVIYVVGSQLSCLGRVLKTQIYNALLDRVLIV